MKYSSTIHSARAAVIRSMLVVSIAMRSASLSTSGVSGSASNGTTDRAITVAGVAATAAVVTVERALKYGIATRPDHDSRNDRCEAIPETTPIGGNCDRELIPGNVLGNVLLGAR